MYNRKVSDKKYRESNEGIIVHNRAQKRYRKTDKGKEVALRYDRTSNGKVMKQKKDAKHRQLGFIPLNEVQENCVAHHISENFVIYIPKKLHESMYHNIWNWKNMNIMNKYAFEFAGIV